MYDITIKDILFWYSLFSEKYRWKTVTSAGVPCRKFFETIYF